MSRIRFGFSFLTALLIALNLGCGGGRSASSGASSSTTGAPPGSGTGTTQVLMTAEPAPNFVQSVIVSFDRVTVYPSGGGAMPLVDQGPVNLPLSNSSIDLVSLPGGAPALLASGVVMNGDYDRLEVSVSNATITYTGGANVSMQLRSNVVDIPASFTVPNGVTVQVVLDFDTGGSVQISDKGPTLRPTIRVSSVQ
ncbi:MAG TPA: DUF4382 domain-containing protein [Candidatus Polarisedimenticolia bacterium]|jgi:hypothetical protein|nr:DUF4382 domain-containing protein [Candidatus Polarisedimenticolia bacterium]